MRCLTFGLACALAVLTPAMVEAQTPSDNGLSARVQEKLKAAEARSAALDELQKQVEIAIQLLSTREEELDLMRLRAQDLTGQLDDLERERNDVAGALESCTTERESLADRFALLEQRANDDRQSAEQTAAELDELNEAVAQLRRLRAQLEDDLASQTAALTASETASADRKAQAEACQASLTERDAELAAERVAAAEAKAAASRLAEEVSVLRRQLGRIEKALEAAEQKDTDSQLRIADLGRRLNEALAAKVEELQQYRSEFFAELKQSLANQAGVKIAGDRFVLQAEVLFPAGSADLGPSGRDELGKLADMLLDVAGRIPPKINWVMRVDGHTDNRPIQTARFPSNWELSTARAVSVVKFLVDNGVPPTRLAATGFGAFQPIDRRDDEIAHRRNRRIEFKLTER